LPSAMLTVSAPELILRFRGSMADLQAPCQRFVSHLAMQQKEFILD